MHYNELIYKDIKYTTVMLRDDLERACINHGLNGLDDLYEINSTRFALILEDVGDIIHECKALKCESDISHRYDVNKLKIILDIYIQLTREYNKRPSLLGFYGFSGLNDRYLNDNERMALNGFDAYCRKRITEADAERVANQATDSKAPILNLAYNNYHHNWSGQIRQQEIRAEVKTLEDIQRERLETKEQEQRFGFGEIAQQPQ